MVHPLRYMVFLLLSATLFLPKAKGKMRKWANLSFDSTYINNLTHDLTVRVYTSRKYVYYTLKDVDQDLTLKYRPSDIANFGLGFSYKLIGVNIGLNFPFVNNNKQDLGNTHYFDLQSHLYLRKLAVDFYGQYYKGYYLYNASDALINYPGQPEFPLRPDLVQIILGLDVHYVFNGKKFSLRAAFLQNERQKKSAGSVLLGGGIYSIFINADSTIVPSNIKSPYFFSGFPFSHSNVYCITGNVDYAYTFVIEQTYFFTGALSVGVGANYTTMKYDDNKEDAIGLQVNSTWRVAAGYNSDRYYIGLSYAETDIRSAAPFAGSRQNFGAGNLRVTFAWRFKLKKEYLRFME